MRKLLFFILIFAVVTGQTAFAHPPTRIEINYEPNTKTIEVVVHHAVANPRTHYIKEIDVLLNGKKRVEDKFTRQSNDNNQPASYEMPYLKAGDTITVEAYCSVSGKKTASIAIK